MTLRALALTLALSLPAPAAPHALPDPSFKDLAGNRHRLSSLHGTVVVVSFWATWCTPCQEELPRLSHLNDAYANKPVTFLALSIDENKSRDQLTRFLAERNLHLPVWTGATTDTMAALGLPNIVPSTLILDQAGEPITRITGEARDEDIRSRIDWLLNNRPDPAPAPTLRRLALSQ